MLSWRNSEGKSDERRISRTFRGIFKNFSLARALRYLRQAGVPRSKDQILQELERQVKLACSGVIKHVKDSQTRTGVKDTYTQFWIDQLISRFKETKKNDPDRSVQDIQKELIQWTIDNREKIYSPFLTMKGVYTLFSRSNCINKSF
jgi:hypothetical protein